LTCFRFDISPHYSIVKVRYIEEQLGDWSPRCSLGYQSPLSLSMWVGSS